MCGYTGLSTGPHLHRGLSPEAAVVDFPGAEPTPTAAQLHADFEGQPARVAAARRAAQDAEYYSPQATAARMLGLSRGSREEPHTVERGDSLSKIASLYKDRGITIQDIIKANNIEDPNKIEIGQELKIPARPVGKRDDDEGIPTPGRNLAEAWGFNMDLSKLNE